MKYALSLVATAAGISQVTATFGWHDSPGYTTPGNSDGYCLDDYKHGLDWLDLPTGGFDSYKGFKWSGFECSEGFGKRDALGARTFEGKCITGRASSDYGSSPNFSCDQDQGVDKTTVSEIHVHPEFDCDLEFHFGMPDGSTCKQRSPCSAGGSVISNTQCGGAHDVTVVYPHQPELGDHDGCDIAIPSIKFDCDEATYPTHGNPGYPTQTPPADTPTPTGGYPGGTPPVDTPTGGYPSGTPPPVDTPTETPPVDTPTGGYPGSTPPVDTPTTTPTPPVDTPTGGYPHDTPPPVDTPTETPTTYPTPPVDTPTETPPVDTPTGGYPSGTPPVDTPTGTPPVDTPTTYPTPPTDTPTETPTGGYPHDTPPPVDTPTETPPPVDTPTETPPVDTPTGGYPGGPPPPETTVSKTSPVDTPTGGYPTGGNPPVDTPTTTAPSYPSDTPVTPLPCPSVVPSCLNTWLSTVGCKDNSDSQCFCPDSKFVENVFTCIYAHGADDDEISEAIDYFKGVCAGSIPKNPEIITGADTITQHLTVTKTLPAGDNTYTTIYATQTVVVPCTDDEGKEIPSSSTTSTLTTTMTVPQVHFTTVTDTPGTTDVAIIPGTAPVAYPSKTPAPYPTASFTYSASPTGGVYPTAPIPSTIPTGGAANLAAGLFGVVAVAIAAL